MENFDGSKESKEGREGKESNEIQIDRRNLECEVILPGDTSMRMADLLPRAWLEPLFARD